MRSAGLIMIVALAACSSPERDQADPPAPRTTTYEFAEGDLHGGAAKDICRQQDADFALNLMGRVDAALPIEAKGSAKLDRFLVQDRFDGNGKEAVLWFTANHAGKNGVTMFATGAFQPDGCEIGEMAASVGTDLHEDAGKGGFSIR